MTLVSIKNELIKARDQHYAIPLINVFEMQGMEGVMEALIEKRAPTIIGVYSPYAAKSNCRSLAAYIRCRADDTDVPISLMLDHGTSVEQCSAMIANGFTDVMYDGSSLPLDENITNTKKVVAIAHAAGVGVEAEIGHVGKGDQYEVFGNQRIGFTDPEIAECFVAETDVDFLAIAFGNAHGFYTSQPKLDLALVAEIRKRVNVPLVMHGGTGISDEQFRQAIAAGISKINFATGIMYTAVDNMRLNAAKPEASMLDIADGIRSSYAQWGKHLFEVFGTKP